MFYCWINLKDVCAWHNETNPYGHQASPALPERLWLLLQTKNKYIFDMFLKVI